MLLAAGMNAISRLCGRLDGGSNSLPVVVISDTDRLYLETEPTVVCLSIKADKRYNHSTPVLPNDVIDNAHLNFIADAIDNKIRP